MAYGINQLRKAGRALQDFDDRYSQKIKEMYDYKDGEKTTGSADTRQWIGNVFGGAIPSTRRLETTPADDSQTQKVLAAAMSYGMPAVSAVPKYVAPTVGVTLAGQALVDLAGQFGQQTSGTLEP